MAGDPDRVAERQLMASGTGWRAEARLASPVLAVDRSDLETCVPLVGPDLVFVDTGCLAEGGLLGQRLVAGTSGCSSRLMDPLKECLRFAVSAMN